MVVIDVPPLLGVDDGRMLAMLADDVIFAILWGRTSRAAAAGALKPLRSASASVFGAVLTRVDPKKHALSGEGDSLQYQHAFRKYSAGSPPSAPTGACPRPLARVPPCRHTPSTTRPGRQQTGGEGKQVARV